MFLAMKETKHLKSHCDLTLVESKESRRGRDSTKVQEGGRVLRRLCTIKMTEHQNTTYEHLSRCYRKKTQADCNFILQSLKSHFTFSQQQDHILQALVKRFSLCALEAEQYLFKQEDNASSFFILYYGALIVEINGVYAREILPGEGFGELALLYDSPRSASIRSKNKCYLWSINRYAFMHAVKSGVEQTYQNNLQSINNCKRFNYLNKKQKEQLASVAVRQHFKQNNYLCKKSQTPIFFLMLVYGQITSIKNAQDKEGSQIKNQVEFSPEIEYGYDQIEKQSEIWLKDVKAMKDTHVLALSTKDMNAVLGRNLPQAILRNKLHNALKQTTAYSKMNTQYREKLLDCFKVRNKLNSAHSICFNQENNTLVGWDTQTICHCDKVSTSQAQIQASFGCSLKDALLHSVAQKNLQKQWLNQSALVKQQAQNYILQQLVVYKELGAGTFGKVFLVGIKNKLFALKCIQKAKILSNKMSEYLYNEKNILQSIISPFKVDYIRSFCDSTRIYFLLQYVHGPQLFQVMRQLPSLPEDFSRFYLALLLHTVEYFHEKGVIHRDLKPQNILINADGYTKVVDMGTCKRTDKTYTIIGTPNYMAPEVIVGKGYTAAADLWSLGVIAYELLIGQLPYDADDVYSLYERIVKDPLQLEAKGGPPQALLRRLLDKNPFNRLGGSYLHLKHHAFFHQIQWYDLAAKRIVPPYQVKLSLDLGQGQKIMQYFNTPKCNTLTEVTKKWDQEFYQ